MVVFILEILFKMKFQEEENINGLMVKHMKGNGKETKCMDMEFYHGKMGKNMKGIL
jgi:hypothetical protein